MTIAFRKASLITFILLSAHGAIHAQEQTVESAQKFLEQVLPSVKVDTNSWTLTSGKFANIDRFGDITKVETIEGCLTKISLKYGQFKSHLTQWNNETRRPQNLEWGPTSFVEPLDFSKWSEVKSISKTRIKVFRIDRTTLDFHSPSESMIARLAFALDFLRQKCDTTSATGF